MADFVYELLAKIGLDDREFNSRLNGAGDNLQGWGSKAAKIAAGAAKVIGAGIAAGAAAVGAITKQAIESYSEYEQLVGGVETLFGESADKVKEYAENAYQTAGMSANEYMETVTSFSASLLQSLGGDTEKAADYADKAITDMADNANKMGSSMESIQNAYQGFAKQNYTMLDNLKLGYGGTKSEMERLVEDAENLSDSFEAQRDASGNLALSYADIVDAIHIVQENMGITGTTAKEASETIKGSITSMKAAWKNLVTGLADDNADIEKLVSNFTKSVTTVAKNVLPRITTVLKNVAKAAKDVVKELIPVLVDAITENLPSLVQSGVELIAAIVTGLVDALPQLIAAIPDIISAIVDGLKESWPALKEAGGKLLEMVALGLAEGTWYLWTAVGDALSGLTEQIGDALSPVAEDIETTVSSMVETVQNGFNTAKQNVTEAVSGIAETLKSKYEEMSSSLSESIGKRLEAVNRYIQDTKQRISDFSEGLKSLVKDAMQWLYDHTIGKLVEVANGIKEKLAQVKQHFQDLIDAAYVWGQDLITNFADGIAAMFPHLTKAVGWVTEKIKGLLGHSHPKEGPLADDYKWMPDMMQLFAKGIKDNAHLVTDQIGKSFDISDSVKQVSSPIESGLTGATTVNNYNNITVNGIEELQELLRWFESRQVIARMA